MVSQKQRETRSYLTWFLLVREAGLEPAKMIIKPLRRNVCRRLHIDCVVYRVISKEDRLLSEALLDGMTIHYMERRMSCLSAKM